MTRLLQIMVGLTLLSAITYIVGIRYLNSGPVQPDNTVWQSYIGRDTTVGILPDKHANYYTYTLVRTNKNTGFKIKGDFPDTRYFSFNVYSLGDNATQGSLVDYQIHTDSGKPNPFLANKDSLEVGEKFTAHIVPSKYKHVNLSNVLPFRDDVKLLTMVIRLYDYNIDDFGGVNFPTVEAFKIIDKPESPEFIPIHLPKGLDLRWIVRKRKVKLCNCKQTRTRSFCENTHLELS